MLLSQSARLAQRVGGSFKEIRELAGLAYFSELRRRGMTQRQAAQQLDISSRKASQLGASLRETFWQSDREAGLPRRIEYILWAAPASRARIKQVLPDIDEALLERAIDALIEEGRVEERGERTPVLRVTRGEARLVKDDWISRLDGVENLVRSVGDTIVHRFLVGGTASMARTLSFRMRRDDLDELRDLYENVIWPRLVALERKSEDADDIVEMDLSICWAPASEGESK